MNGVNQDTLNRKRFQIELVHLYLFQQQIHRTLVVWVLAVWLHGWTGGGERGIILLCFCIRKIQSEKKRSTKKDFYHPSQAKCEDSEWSVNELVSSMQMTSVRMQQTIEL